MIIETKVNVEIDTDELADSLSRETLFDLIKDLDESVGNWDFTLKLYEHFVKLKKTYDQIHNEDNHEHSYSDTGMCSCGFDLYSKDFDEVRNSWVD